MASFWVGPGLWVTRLVSLAEGNVRSWEDYFKALGECLKHKIFKEYFKYFK